LLILYQTGQGLLNSFNEGGSGVRQIGLARWILIWSLYRSD